MERERKGKERKRKKPSKRGSSASIKRTELPDNDLFWGGEDSDLLELLEKSFTFSFTCFFDLVWFGVGLVGLI